MKTLLFFLITFSATRFALENSILSQTRFVVWNIGQGQWTTLIEKKYCDHFDMGGEFDVSRKVIQSCEGREHRLHISHWDWDHIGLIKNMRWRGAKICLWNYPLGEASAKKKHLLDGLPHCLGPMPYNEVFEGDIDAKASSNDSSQVVVVKNILIPGDSTKKEEKKWSHRWASRNSLGLILGHHGSRSSTSQTLLDRLPNLRWAVATARKKRYRHPHPEIVQRLRMNKVPLLVTEDWGNLVFEL